MSFFFWLLGHGIFGSELNCITLLKSSISDTGHGGRRIGSTVGYGSVFGA
jgi:hypothetical protein